MTNLVLMNSGSTHALLGSSSLTSSNNVNAATIAALNLTANLTESDASSSSSKSTKASSSSSSSSPHSIQLLQQHQQLSALQQLMATQTMFSTLTPEQLMVAQQLTTDSLQFNLLKDFPQNLQVIILVKNSGSHFFIKKISSRAFFLSLHKFI